MPLTRYQARNEYGLADPDLYQAADKDDPEALLEGVAMAGLVGILRQLGDLAEFAAEMFHDLHEEVMATASRSHGLMARVQQLESEFPYIEKAMLCQTDHSPFFSNKGVEWHPNLQLEQSVITRGDLPRCVMDSYEECRGPPRLFLLDKFDISGAGACLKRYTDPSFVRLETSSYETSWDNIQREKKSQKAKKRSSHWRNGGTPENALSSHAKLHELFMEEHLETNHHHSDSARAVKLKTRKLDGYSLISKSGESYMEKFVQTCFDNKTGYQIITPNPELLTWNMDSDRNIVTDILPEEVLLPNEENSNLNGSVIEKDIETVPESNHSEVSGTTVTKDSFNGKLIQNRSYSEDLTSEADNYVDAPATMESEAETDDECKRKHVDEDPSKFSFSLLNGNTPMLLENGQSSFGKQSTYSCSDTASNVDDSNVHESVSSSNVDGQTPSSSRIVSHDDDDDDLVRSLAPEVVDGSKTDPIDSSRSCAFFDDKSFNEESRSDTIIDKSDTVDYSSNILNSGTSPSQVLVDDDESNSGGDPKSCNGSGLVDETDCVTATNAVDDADTRNSVTDVASQSSVAEVANGHACDLVATSNVSVSESHEDILENGMPDASPTHSKRDEQESDEDFRDLPGLDNTVTDIAPEVELVESESYDDTSSTLPSTKGSLPWISTSTLRSSFKAAEDAVVVESDATLQESPLEASSEHQTTYIDDNVRESGESASPMPSQDQSEGDKEAESYVESILVDIDDNVMASSESTSPMPSQDQSEGDKEAETYGQSILVDGYIDSSPVTDNLLASEAIEPTVTDQTPCGEELEFAPQLETLEWNGTKQELDMDPMFPSFGLIPDSETTPPDMPPLPPMQWLLGKAPLSFPTTFTEESVDAPSLLAPTVGSSLNAQTGFQPSDLSVSLASEKISEQPHDEFVPEEPLQSPADLNSQYESSELPTIPIEEFGSEENQELDNSQESSLQLPQELSEKHEDLKNDTESSRDDDPETITTEVEEEEKDDSVPDASSVAEETAEASNTCSVQKSVGDAMLWPVNAFSLPPTLDTTKPEVVPTTVKLPRPRSPLVDAVAAHDRRTMKKVSEMVQPPIKSKQDDNDSLLAQIRNKSVNLKPATSTRPSIQTGPKTNLRVAAILEKANTIRMAMAGSDEDEDSDSWSDS